MPNNAAKKRVMFYGGVLAALYAFYLWVPWEYDFVPRKLPVPNPPVDPNPDLLFSGNAKVLLITAHPDDSAFYVGGTLSKLAYCQTEIHQIICTDGDKGYYPFEDWQRNRRERRKEALEEARAWGGKDILFLGEPDGRFMVTNSVVEKIRQRILAVKPDYILCFDGEYPTRVGHRDHRRAGIAALEAAKASGLSLWLLQFQTIAPNHVVDISTEWHAKQQLLALHGSQFYGKRLQMIINMVGETAIQHGELGGFTYGEALRCLHLP